MGGLTTQTRFWMVLVLFSIGVMVLGRWLGDRSGLLWGFSIAFSVNCLFYFYSDRRLIHLFRARRIEGQDPWHVLRMVRELCQRAGLAIPAVYIVDSPSAQILAAGRSGFSGRIILTEGLLRTLDPAELKAVLAVQVIHLKSNNSYAFSAVGLFVGMVLTSTRFLDRWLRLLIDAPRDIEERQGGYLTGVIAPLAAGLLRLCISKGSFLEADAKAGDLSGDRSALARALWKLDSLAQTRPLRVPASLGHMFIVNPLTRKGWFRYFRIQPDLATRTRHLVGQYPL
jgi:heat shock protein HtpX